MTPEAHTTPKSHNNNEANITNNNNDITKANSLSPHNHKPGAPSKIPANHN